MATMIFISSVAMLVGIVGSFFIWRLDASRADEVEHEQQRVDPTARARRSLDGGDSPKGIESH